MTDDQIKKIEKLAEELNDEALSKEPGMVCQLWQDGEITLQKSGELLWQRTLHQSVPQKLSNSPIKLKYSSGENSYVFVTQENAYRVRAMMGDGEDVYDSIHKKHSGPLKEGETKIQRTIEEINERNLTYFLDKKD